VTSRIKPYEVLQVPDDVLTVTRLQGARVVVEPEDTKGRDVLNAYVTSCTLSNNGTDCKVVNLVIVFNVVPANIELLQLHACLACA